MNKGFTKKQLERIGCSNEEIELVMNYQKKLPVLLKDDKVEKFCVNARELHKELCVKKKYTDWIRKNAIECKEYEKDTDFITSPAGECMLTVDVAKEIAMYTGRNSQASDEVQEMSRMVRRYFILMEKIVKDNIDWEEVRYYERTHYKPMCEALSNFIQRNTGRSGDGYDFALEANRLNVIATGNRAQSLKNYFGIQTNELTRDSLEKEYNEKISFLQDQNILLLGMNMPIQDRLKMLISMFDIQYPNAVDLIRGDRESLEQARKNLFL